MKGGDVITQLGDYAVSDIYSYMEALGKFKKGEATTVTVLRGNETLTLNVVF
jgi:S1-C subfamily serine protease